ncbi:MAG TPA: hypothetical protein DD619_03820 [Alphaproteobacteria bacterium]|nr:hypothetical protein [Alphaproteobacteria bacterium]
MKQNQLGRSMIEMLGVLAIIGVLSVGGIAGYSKAMQKWKSNLQLNMLSELIANGIKIKSNLNKKSQSFDNITPVIAAMGDLPEQMTYKDDKIIDKDGNIYTIMYGYQSWTYSDGSAGGQFKYVILIYFTSQANTTLSLSVQDLCKNIVMATKAAAEEVYNVYLLSDETQRYTILYTKDSLKTASVSDINQKCKQLLDKSNVAHFGILLNPY